MGKKNNEIAKLLEKILLLVKTNISLLIIYPIIILINFKIIKIFSDLNSLKLYLVIVMISQFEIGYIKEIVVHKKRLLFKDLLLLMTITICVVTLLMYYVVNYFKVSFSVNFIIVIAIGMVLNEVKSFFDSKKHYDYGFLIKSLFLIAIPFVFLLKNECQVFLILISILLVLLLLSKVLITKFSDFLAVELHKNLNFFRFFTINFFSFLGGNIDRFLIFPNVGLVFFNQYVVFTESNSKLNSAFGFLNNLFFFGHLTLNRYLVTGVFVLLNICFFFIHTYFNLSIEYYIFSLSTLFSILGQYFIFSYLKEIKHTSSSFFSAVGILVFLSSFFLIKSFFSITIITMTFLLILKNFSEIFYLYYIKKRAQL